MFIKNISKKPIGFGKLVVMPDKTEQLPKGFDRKHSIVAWYIENKFIAEVNTLSDSPDTTQAPVNEPVGGTEKPPEGDKPVGGTEKPPEAVQTETGAEKPSEEEKKRNKKITD